MPRSSYYQPVKSDEKTKTCAARTGTRNTLIRCLLLLIFACLALARVFTIWNGTEARVSGTHPLHEVLSARITRWLPTDPQTTLIQSNLLPAVNASWLQSAPAPLPVDSKRRVAHCLTGQPRTLNLPEVYSGYRTQAMQGLDAPSNLFLVLDGRPGIQSRRSDNTSNGVDKSLYKAALDFLEPSAVLWVTEKHFLDTCRQYPDACKKNVYYEMQLKYEFCYRLVREFEIREQVRFSHIVLTRPDVMLLRNIGPARDWTTDTIMSPPYRVKMKGPMPDKPISYELGRCVPVLEDDYLCFVGTDVFNIVPATLAHRLFRDRLLSAPSRPLLNSRKAGDGQWRLALDDANITRSIHCIEFRLRRSHQMCTKFSPDAYLDIC